MNATGDDELPTRIDTLIQSPEGDEGESDALPVERDLGPFRILRKLGEGGMGQVYLARQLQPVERDVALKLILRKVLNPHALARFDVEQQALAQMSHPAIAQVFDAGTTPSGYPYFAMEFVDGEPLGEFCRRHRLSLSDRLRLMVRICRGVQHAHQRGIIHRDLKPGNILVARIDGVPRPKIIDFGIARATEVETEDAAARDVVGTPQYMSPEQFHLDEVVLDPRSDVYSLGVILHELLVGCPPIEGERLSRVDSTALSQVFAEHQPMPAPSTRLGRDAATDRRVAEQRRIHPRGLRRRLKKDLDAIVLKALAHARDDRYSSPSELADDLERALGHYPVSAVPATPAYRMRRFIQRNTLAVGSASAILLALVAGLTAATLGMLEAQRQFEIAQQRQSELEQVTGFQQAMLAELDPQDIGLSLFNEMRDQYAAGLEGEQRREALAAFERILVDLNATDIARHIIDEQLLMEARESIEEQFGAQPKVSADLLESIADVYMAIGRSSTGLALRRRVLGLRRELLPGDHIDVLTARHDYSYAYFQDDQLDRAEEEVRALIEVIDESDPQALSVLASARQTLAFVLVDQGRIDEAIELIEARPPALDQVLEDDPQLRIDSRSNAGYVLARAGRIEEALVEFQSALDQTRAVEGPDHPAALRAMANVGAALGALGRYDEALATDTELLERLSATVGRQHTSTLRVMSNRSNNLRRLGREDEALALLQEAREISHALLGPLNPVTMRIRLNLGSLLTQLDQTDEGLEILDAVIADRSSVLGADHPETLTAMEVRVSNLTKQARYGEAEALIDEVISGRQAAFGDDHPQVDQARWLKGIVLRDSGRVEAALELLRPLAEDSLAQAPRSGGALARAVDVHEALRSVDPAAAERWYAEKLTWLIESDPASLDARQQAVRSELLANP